jgi:hypothetical protein
MMTLEDYAETLRLLLEAVSTLHQAMDALPPAAGALYDNFNRARDAVLVLRAQVEQYALSHP